MVLFSFLILGRIAETGIAEDYFFRESKNINWSPDSQQ